MDKNLLFTTIITIVLAFAGYIITYLNNLRLAQRTERLDRVNRQLSEFYGPMFALIHATEITWSAFRSEYRVNNNYYFDDKNPPNNEEQKEWRLWIINVFMPINIRLYELVLSKSDLLVESEMPECLLLLCAHVAAYQSVLKKWESGDYSDHVSLVNFPSQALLDYAAASFYQLKAEQTKLLGDKVKTAKNNFYPSTIRDSSHPLTYQEYLKFNNHLKDYLEQEDVGLRSTNYHLSNREKEIIKILIEDPNTTNLAKKLGVESATAKAHIRTIYMKFGVRNREDLIKIINKEKLLHSE